MKTPIKILMILVVAGAAAGAVVLKNARTPGEAKSGGTTTTRSVAAPTNAPLPKLLDLGAGKCVPCKLMAPILEELKKEYAGRMAVEFIDVWENTEAAKKYGIETIPTQIFYNAAGKELFRHVGFFGREDILGKWRELGVNL